jgi:hypothetical protein
MTRAALPTRQHIYRLDAVNGRVPLSLAEELKIKKPNAPIVAIDLGTLDNKDGYLLEPSKLYVEKVPNFLTKVQSHPGEQVHLSIAIPFESARDFARKEAKIRQTIGESISWGAGDGSRTVEVLTLKIDPEDYHAELFSRFYSQDIPNFEGEDRATIGLGFRTCNLGFISADGYYDDVRSLSFDGKGTSLFYEWVGKEIGVEDWNTAYFIQAVNSGADTFRPQGSDEELELGEAIELARGWYVSEIFKLVKKHTPPEVDKFVICGGGAIRKGPHLQKKLWGRSLICPESDIANVAGQLVELALELQAV